MAKSARTTAPKRIISTSRNPARAFGRTLGDFGRLSKAEKHLLACCRLGDVAVASDRRPESENASNRVRAEFIRFLALGGDDQVAIHEHGVRLNGAWVDGVVDIASALLPFDLALLDCRLDQIDARGAITKSLIFSGSLVERGLNADALQSGRVLLREGFHSKGQVSFFYAQLGELDCRGGRFENRKQDALIGDHCRIAGNLVLSKGFHANGQVRFVGAVIGGNLICNGGRFINWRGWALQIYGMRVVGVFDFHAVKRLTGMVLVAGVRVDTLWDDSASWAKASGKFILDGFTYQRLSDAPTDAATRLRWLDLQWPDHVSKDFKPQPWEQLIKVLREMGHTEQARLIAYEKQRRIQKAGLLPKGIRPLHWIYGALIGYGYRPIRLFAITAAVWLVCAGAYWWAANPAWQLGPPQHLIAPATASSASAPPYRNFVPLVYSADVLLPVVDLGYKDEWQPRISDGDQPLVAGQLLRFLYWFEIAFGWVAGLLLVSVLGGLIKKD